MHGCEAHDAAAFSHSLDSGTARSKLHGLCSLMYHTLYSEHHGKTHLR